MKLLNQLKSDGKTILILSNNLLPYESICNKIAIIAEGEMKFVNTPEIFRERSSKGLKLTVEFKDQESEIVKNSKITEIKNYIQGSFLDSKLRFTIFDIKFLLCLNFFFFRAEDSNSLTFTITLNHMKLSEMFKILEELKTYDITRYSVTENSFENFMSS